MPDARIVYGASCVWWDDIGKVGTRGGLPVCPHCGGVLFEMPSEAEWWAGVDAHEARGHAGYRKFVEWLRGRCYRDQAAAEAAYRATEGRDA